MRWSLVVFRLSFSDIETHHVQGKAQAKTAEDPAASETNSSSSIHLCPVHTDSKRRRAQASGRRIVSQSLLLRSSQCQVDTGVNHLDGG